MTSKQMSYYYGQPLVHCYLLHAEWLAERYEKKADLTHLWEVREELLRSVLHASNNAQNHLLDLQLVTLKPRRPGEREQTTDAGVDGSTDVHPGDVLDQ